MLAQCKGSSGSADVKLNHYILDTRLGSISSEMTACEYIKVQVHESVLVVAPFVYIWL